MNPIILVRHHYLRGCGFGRMLWEDSGPQKTRQFRFYCIFFFFTKYPLKRIFYTIKGVIRWGKPMRGYFVVSFPLMLVGTMSAALGAVFFLLRPESRVMDHRNHERSNETKRET